MSKRTTRIGGPPKKQQPHQKSRQVRITFNNDTNNNNNNHRPYRNRNRSQDTAPKVVISGVPQTVDREDLMGFLKTKAYKPNLVFTNNEFRNGKLYLSLEKADDIGSLTSLSNIRYGGAKITIDRDFVPKPRGTTRPLQEKKLHEKLVTANQTKQIEDHINRTYVNNPNQNFIDFQYLNASNIDFNSEKTLKILFRIIKDKCPKATTISFAHNNITTLSGFKFMIKHSLDNIINFNFSDNKISDFTDLDFLSDLSLRELIFMNNPISMSPNYRLEVARRFPDLTILDNKPIGPEDFPPSPIPPLRGNFCDSLERQQFAYRFLEKYLTAFDKSRNEILSAYGSDSKFSMTFTTDRGAQTRGSTKTYLRANRNLKKPMENEKKSQLLYQGAADINSFFKLFPATSHYLKSSCIDTFLVPGSSVLFVIIHGHYMEPIFNLKRSFDRTFSLVPASPESAKFGWEATILNEQFNVRPYIRFPRLEQPQTSQPPVADVNQDSLISQFATATLLKPEFARECLLNNAWDPAKAMEMFNSLKAQNQVPPNYYM